MFLYIYYSVGDEEYVLQDSAFSKILNTESFFTFEIIRIYKERNLSVLNALTIFYSQKEIISNKPFRPEDTWNTNLADPTRSLFCIKEDLKAFNKCIPSSEFQKYYCQLVHRFTKFSSLYSGCDNSFSILNLYKNKLSTFRH